MPKTSSGAAPMTIEQRAAAAPHAGREAKPPALGWLLLGVAVAGAAGALLRVTAAELVPEYGMKFPWTTFAVNMAGSLLLGLLVGVAHARTLSGWVIPVLGTGLLASFTTFSTVMVASADSMTNLAESGTGAMGLVFAPSPEVEWLAYLGISVLLCTGSAAAGITIGRAIFGRTAMPRADVPEARS